MCDCVRVCLMYLLQLLLFANIIFCSMQSPLSWYFSELRSTPQFTQLCRALPVSRHICTARVYGVLQTCTYKYMYTACVLRKARGKILNIIDA